MEAGGILYPPLLQHGSEKPLLIFVHLRIKAIPSPILTKCFTTRLHSQTCDLPIATSFHPKGNGFPGMCPTVSRDAFLVIPFTSSAACQCHTSGHSSLSPLCSTSSTVMLFPPRSPPLMPQPCSSSLYAKNPWSLSGVTGSSQGHLPCDGRRQCAGRVPLPRSC